MMIAVCGRSMSVRVEPAPFRMIVRMPSTQIKVAFLPELHALSREVIRIQWQL